MSATTEDKFKKFENEGVTFKAKLIGGELVMEPRGDRMCQNSIQRLKAIIKGQKAHKRRILLKISYAGVKVCDEKTNEILYHHEVPQISFIASDDTDSRTFGYVCDVPNKAHQFICFKTSGPAVQVMSEISSLFEAVLEKKKQKKEQAGDEPQKQSQQQYDQNSDCVLGEEENSKSRANMPQLISSNSKGKDDYFVRDLRDIHISSAGSGDNGGATEFTKLDESPFDPFTTGSGGGGSSSIGAGGDSGIMDLTFNDWLSSPQQETTQVAGPQAPTQYPYQQHYQQQYQHQQVQQDDQRQQQQQKMSTPFDSSPAIPIAREPRPRPSINFTSSSFSAGQFANDMSKTTPVAAPLANTGSPSAVFNPAANPNNRFTSAQNRSLIYNHSSVSLNDAALSNRSPAVQQPRHESTDKYAVFNDIDALPSIFESISSLDSASKLSNAGQQMHPGSQSMDFRQHQQPQAAFRRQQYSTSASDAAAVFNATSSTTKRQSFQLSTQSSGMPPRQMSNPFDDDFFA